MTYTIRNTISDDAKRIHEIALMNKIDFENTENTQNGFLVYVMPEEGYLSRINQSSYFYVAQEDNKLDGFLMCYDDRVLDRLVDQGLMKHEADIVHWIKNYPRPYIFADQIAVAKHRQDIGTQLMRRLFEDMKIDGIRTVYAAILKSPVRNEASLAFFANLGSKTIAYCSNGNTWWNLEKKTIL